ncbi:MAG: hypothetical protein WAV41_04645 [Microgenomates group bacterium]
MAQIIFLIFLILYYPIVTRLYSYLLNGNKNLAIASTIATTPLFLSLFLYTIFYFLPSYPQSFYLTILATPAIALNFILKSKFTFPKVTKLNFSQIPKVYITLLAIPILLITMRIWFWPINWDDQIYYIEQAYSIGQERSLETFLNWGTFKNNQLIYNINPSIRPGLPLIYSLSSLVSGNLTDTTLFSQTITFYYFIVFIVIFTIFLRLVDPKHYSINSLIGIFLVFTSYLFVNLTVLGFKEIIIVCLMLLSILRYHQLTTDPSIKLFVYLGILFGFMSYINYSGSLLACMFIVQTFFVINSKIIQKLARLLLFTFILTLVSGLEFIYFFNVLTNGKITNITVKQVLVQSYNKIRQFNSTSTGLKPTAVEPATRPSEYRSYGINTAVDVYSKGKLQGFFQIQYYGIIFLVFLATVVLFYQPLVSNQLTRTVLIFITLFFLIFIDIFGLNKHKYAEILTVSHKYTAFLVPFVSILISSQWHNWKILISRLNTKILMLTLAAMIVTGALFSTYPELIYGIVKIIIPIHSTESHYFQVIKNGGFELLFIGLILSVYFLINKKNSIDEIKHIYILIIFVLSPFLLFFDSNFGIYNTLFKSFSSYSQKLLLIPGWESLYTPINYLNSLPPDSKFLFINTNTNQLGIHLRISAHNTNYTSVPVAKPDSYNRISNMVKQTKSEYLIVHPDQFQFPRHQLMIQTNDFSVYKINFPN